MSAFARNHEHIYIYTHSNHLYKNKICKIFLLYFEIYKKKKTHAIYERIIKYKWDFYKYIKLLQQKCV